MSCTIYLCFCLGDKNAALLNRISLLVKAVHDEKMSLDDALKSSALSSIKVAIDNWRSLMLTHGTARLWIQYQRMVEILRAFICSVRTVNWSLYLQSLCDMHPYLAAAGHNYTKSLALFIPKMLDLEHTHPDVHAAFTKSLFPARRADGKWSGIFSDLFIEQVLMAGIKSTGGLTHGRAFNESTRLQFLLSKPICAEVSQSIFEIAGLSSNAEDGHRDLTQSRIRRDMADVQKLLQVLLERETSIQPQKSLSVSQQGLLQRNQ